MSPSDSDPIENTQINKKNISDPRAVIIKRALISVSRKRDLEKIALVLKKHGVEILSTSGTALVLKDYGVEVTEISDYTGFSGDAGGQVKTLHNKVHFGILARTEDGRQISSKDEDGHDIGAIDLVIVNVYPFSDIVSENDSDEDCIKNIDTGRIAMIRAAAKNHKYVTVVTDPQDYDKIIKDMNENDGAVTSTLRKQLAANAFSLSATYDANVASWFASSLDTDEFPRRISFSGDIKKTLCHGENSHQKAALYLDGGGCPGAATASKVQGKELTFNNIYGADRALEIVAEFKDPSVVIIKHMNPCGVASAGTLLEAYKAAFRCDNIGAFGGIVAVNQTLDADIASALIKDFCEVVIAPSISPEAIDILKSKESIRVLTTGAMPEVNSHRYDIKTVLGGFLVQDYSISRIAEDDFKVVSEREPTQKELKDMLFSFKIAKHARSGALVYAKNLASVAIAAGQVDIIDAVRIAVQKSEEISKEEDLEQNVIKGSVLASDLSLSRPSEFISAIELGVTAVIHPGGSIRDEDIIEIADERGIAMISTGERHLLH